MATAIYSREIVGNLVNIQWFVLVAGILLVFRDVPEAPRRKWQVAPWAGLGATAALTMPLLLIVIPFSVWRVCRKRDASCGYEVALTVGSLAQVCIFLNSAEQHVKGYGDVLRTVDYAIGAGVVGFLYRGALSTIGGWDLTYRFIEMGLLATPLLVLLTLALGIGVLWATGKWQDRRHILVALYLAFSSVIISLSGRGYTFVFANIESYPNSRGERYFFLSACMFVYLMALGISKLLKRRSRRVQALALIAIFLFGIAENYRFPAFKDLNWPAHATAVDTYIRERHTGKAAGVVVPVNPEPWIFSIP